MIEAFKLLGEITMRGGEVVEKQLDAVGNKVEKSNSKMKGFGKAIGLVGKGMAIGVTGAVSLAGAVGGLGLKYDSMMESSQVAWKTLLGSQKAAKAMSAQLMTFAKNTQFTYEQVDTMGKYFFNAGLHGKAMMSELTKISDVAGAFNITADNAKELARQMSQVDQAGVAYTSDLDILQNQGIPIFKAIAKEMHTNVAGVRKLASQGKISADIYNKAFDSIAKGVKGSAKAQSKTFAGMISTFEDTAGKFAGDLMNGLFPKIKKFLGLITDDISKMDDAFEKHGLKGAFEAILPKGEADSLTNSINGIVSAVKWIFDNGRALISIIAGIGTAWATFKILTGITKTMELMNGLMVTMEAETYAEAIAQWALNSALLMSPITWIAIAIGLLILVIVDMALHWTTVRIWLIREWALIKGYALITFNWIRDFLAKWGLDILAVITGPIGMLVLLISKHWTQIKIFAIREWTLIIGTLKAKWQEITAFAVQTWNKMKSDVVNKWNEIKSAITSRVDSMKSSITSKWNSLHSATLSTWNNIKNAIISPIESAWHKVESIVSSIRSKFSGLHLSLPRNIALPHFSISGHWSVHPLSVPHLGISWHAQGGYVDGATLIGAGEKGGEGIVPLEGKHMMPMAKAIADYLSTQGSPLSTPTEVPLIINGRELARAIIADIDTELQRRATIRRRGV